MADRVSATIEIGGALAAGLYAEFADVIAGEDLSIEWDGAPFAPDDRTPGEPFRLYAHEVAWGRFEQLEAWCMAHHLPFVRWSGGCSGSWGPERVVFRGIGEPERYAADEDKQIVLCRETVEQPGSYAAILAYFDAAAFEPPPLWVTGDPGTPVSDLVDRPLPPQPDPEGPGTGG